MSVFDRAIGPETEIPGLVSGDRTPADCFYCAERFTDHESGVFWVGWNAIALHAGCAIRFILHVGKDALLAEERNGRPPDDRARDAAAERARLDGYLAGLESGRAAAEHDLDVQRWIASWPNLT